MKVEVGESLMYSYLSHIKKCQLVQTNWKLSSVWEKYNQDQIELFISKARSYFNEKFGYNIFKKTTSTTQILKQCECDVIGVHIKDDCNTYYSIDVAFHEGGLTYGSKKETVERVVAKLIKSAMCLYGCCNAKNVDLIFASPKIIPSIMKELIPCLDSVNELFKKCNLNYTAKIIANDDFKSEILNPILDESDSIADTSELFVRSYQLLKIFNKY